jgi:cytochrome c oxidase subunit 3
LADATHLPAGHAVAGHAGEGGHAAHHPRQQHHFYSMDQQLEASILGMWIFLVTEIMFFGGLFMAYIVYRVSYPDAWAAASNHLNVILGGANTLVLICSSVTMAWAVRCAQIGSRKGQIVNLIFTILFGTTFLVVKYFEYAEKFEHHLVPGPSFDPTLPAQQQIFLWMAAKGRFTPDYYGPIEVSGLYWHFVDIVWIFLFPLLYLLGAHFTAH